MSGAVVTVGCPDCGDEIPVPVTAQVAGKADDGTLQVSVLTDKADVWAHGLTCRGVDR